MSKRKGVTEKVHESILDDEETFLKVEKKEREREGVRHNDI